MQKLNLLFAIAALGAFGYFLYELITLKQPTKTGYACLVAGSIFNLLRIFNNRKK